MRATIVRRGHFNAAHKLCLPGLSLDENYEKFGRCANPNYHGHNFEFEIFVSGEIDPLTGFILDLKQLARMLEDEVEERFDHKNLNLDCPEFESVPPTTENLCYEIWKIVSNKLGDDFKIRVWLHETPRNSAVYPALD